MEKQQLELIRRDLIRILYSDNNNNKVNNIENKSLLSIDLLSQLQEFRLKYKHKYPKFVMYTDADEFYEFYTLLKKGYTLAQIEEIYFIISLYAGELEESKVLYKK